MVRGHSRLHSRPHDRSTPKPDPYLQQAYLPELNAPLSAIDSYDRFAHRADWNSRRPEDPLGIQPIGQRGRWQVRRWVRSDGLPGATVVFFADATAADSCPEDVASASTAGGAGIRFHRDGVQEEQDTIQVCGGVRGQGRRAEEHPEAHGFRSAALAVMCTTNRRTRTVPPAAP